MQIIIWILIILLAIGLIRLLKRWIKRIIFITILLVLAFFIYGIFNPSGAGKLWYNIRTFPQRITSRISNQSFTDYENYKLNLPKIGEKIESDSSDDEIENNSNEINKAEDEDNSLDDNKVNRNDNEPDNNPTIKSFPTFTKFSKIPKLVKETHTNGPLTGYTKSDVLGIINSYIEEHLDDYTDILVTVEYEDNQSDPQKITLETQPRID